MNNKFWSILFLLFNLYFLLFFLIFGNSKEPFYKIFINLYQLNILFSSANTIIGKIKNYLPSQIKNISLKWIQFKGFYLNINTSLKNMKIVFGNLSTKEVTDRYFISTFSPHLQNFVFASHHFGSRKIIHEKKIFV